MSLAIAGSKRQLLLSWIGGVLLLLLCTTALQGCGSAGAGDTQTTSTFHVQQIEACLRHAAGHLRNARVTMDAAQLDDLARRATGGAVAVLFDVTSGNPQGQNRATLVVERNQQVAKATLQRYRAVYKALGGDPKGLVDRRANSVEAYLMPPSKSQRQLVNRCLRKP